MSDTVTISIALTIPKPATDEGLSEVLANVLSGFPEGTPRSQLRLTIEGASDEFAAAFQTSFQIGKAQVAASRNKR